MTFSSILKQRPMNQRPQTLVFHFRQPIVDAKYPEYEVGATNYEQY